MIPDPPSELPEAKTQHATATRRKSPSHINGNFSESQTGYISTNDNAVIRESTAASDARQEVSQLSNAWTFNL